MKQLLTFFALAYLISWTIWLPLYGPVFGQNCLPVLPFHHGIGGLGPMVAAFLTTLIFLKKAGIKRLWAKCVQVRPVGYLVIAKFSPFVLAVLALTISYFISKNPVDLAELIRSKEFPQFHWIAFFFYNLLFFGFGEEVGWRGFALPRFQEKLSPLVASMVLTVFWALWHLPLFFYRPGYVGMGAAGIIGWVFSLLTGSILLTWLYNSTKGSILVCAVFHTTIDLAFTADFTDRNVVNYMGFLITVWGIVTILVFWKKFMLRQKPIHHGA